MDGECGVKVWTMTSLLGFEALLRGKPVTCLGAPFYAGWGLTRDMPGVPQHRFSRTLDEVFAASCLLATRYRDPFRNASASFEETLELLPLVASAFAAATISDVHTPLKIGSSDDDEAPF